MIIITTIIDFHPPTIFTSTQSLAMVTMATITTSTSISIVITASTHTFTTITTFVFDIVIITQYELSLLKSSTTIQLLTTNIVHSLYQQFSLSLLWSTIHLYSYCHHQSHWSSIITINIHFRNLPKLSLRITITFTITIHITIANH